MFILKNESLMKILIKNKHLLILLVLAVYSGGCKKMLQINPPVDQLISSTVFSDSATAQSAVNGMYSDMYNSAATPGMGSSIFSFRISTLPARSADELVSVQGTLDYFESNSLLSSNPDVTGFWSDAYNIIYDANSIIQGVQASPALSATLQRQLIAEATFIRAFCHFYLVNYFGRVPLILTTNVTITNTQPASPVDTIYGQIITDLTSARNVLASDYSWSGGDRTRVNTWAASAMLARVYLYRGQWALAQTEATRVISQTGLYGLVNNLDGVFLANSTEAIWQFYTNVYGYTYFAQQMIPTGQAIPNYAIDSVLYNAFEPGDARKSEWIDSMNIFGAAYTYPYKYQSETDDNAEFDMVIRLAEVYLIRAEALAQQNNIVAAQEDLNVIRARAGLPATTATDQASLLLAIEHERQVELFCEWGHRWLDLKRTGRADAVLGLEKPAGWQPTDTLYPIPQQALNTNPNLKQNPGYH